MNEVVKNQQMAYETTYDKRDLEAYTCHYTKDPWTRFVRDRRLQMAVHELTSHFKVKLDDIKRWKVLVVCGGVGGEGLFFLNQGFSSVTVSDFSYHALDTCKRLDPRLKTMFADCENIDLEENSFDLVVVQDGLHHLSRPALGLTEMLRVASKAVIVIEPHTGMVSKYMGREWEDHDGIINYVFRWNNSILVQTSKSYLLARASYIKCLRFWNHTFAISPFVAFLPKKYKVKGAKVIYGLLDTIFPFLGNQMIGIIEKKN